MSNIHLEASQIELYSVDRNIEDIINELGFSKKISPLDDWAVYTRKTKPKEFIALYRPYNINQYCVWGPYKSANTTKKDLETFATEFFNESNISRFFRTKASLVFKKYSIFLLLGLLGYTLISKGNYYIPLLGGFGLLGAGLLSDKLISLPYNKKLSKLSDGAENYLFGKAAESRLIGEFTYDNLNKSGKKEQFLEWLDLCIRNGLLEYEIDNDPPS